MSRTPRHRRMPTTAIRAATSAAAAPPAHNRPVFTTTPEPDPVATRSPPGRALFWLFRDSRWLLSPMRGRRRGSGVLELATVHDQGIDDDDVEGDDEDRPRG